MAREQLHILKNECVNVVYKTIKKTTEINLSCETPEFKISVNYIHMNLAQLIKEKRPKLSDNSIRTYSSTLASLYPKAFGSGEMEIKRFSEEPEKVMTVIADIPANKRKSILASLVVLTENSIYRTAMMKDILDNRAVQDKQERTPKQVENEVSSNEMKQIYKELEAEAKLIYKKAKRTDKDYQRLQDYIMIALFSGTFIPPRRSLDFTEFKLHNTDDKDCNHMDKNQFIFNKYKNSSTKGQQIIEIPPKLNKIITQFRNVSDNDYLLYDLNGSKYNSTKLTQKLNKLFGKKFSVNGCRHLFMSEKYSDLIDKKNEMKADFVAMGSSENQEKIYIQK